MAPLVRMRALVSGSRDGKKWPKPGETLEVPEAEAAQLIAQGIAEDPAAAELAVVGSGEEKAVAPAGNKSLASLREAARAEAERKAEEEAKAKAAADAKAKADAKNPPKSKES